MEDRYAFSVFLIVAVVAVVGLVGMFWMNGFGSAMLPSQDISYTGKAARETTGQRICSYDYQGTANEISIEVAKTGASGMCSFDRDENKDPFEAGNVELIEGDVTSEYIDICDTESPNVLHEYWCESNGDVMLTKYDCSIGCRSAGPYNHYCDKGRRIVTCV